VLFGYPVAATAENWLHECLREMLHSIHASLEAGQVPQAWPHIIPTAYRTELRRRPGLRDRLTAYQNVCMDLSPAERTRLLLAFNSQNNIAQLLSCASDCEAIGDLPQPIRQPASDLFEFAFNLLSDLGIRDRQYTIIYDAAPHHVCPFCGCEFFDAPGAPHEALDHYLAESKYPFAGANLRNLVPMGDKCNSRYKLAQDILWRDDGVRRRSFDPYNHAGVKISLNNSEPFAGADGQLPDWQIEFDPATEECNTWDQVFAVRERYKRDVLDPSFKGWLGSFGSWFRRSAGIVPATDQDLAQTIRRYVDNLEDMGLSGRDFLRVPVFQMLRKYCDDGDQRLLALIRDLVTGAIGQVANQNAI
jgi:hypothetical protein